MWALCLSCAGELDSPERFTGGVVESRCVVPEDAPTILLPETCGGSFCHEQVGDRAPASGLDLVTPGIADRLRGVPSDACDGRLLIDPAAPDSSHLLVKTEGPPPGCGSKMPIGRDITDEELDCLREWVRQVAAEATP